MAMIISTAARNASCDAFVDLVDAGSTNSGGKLQIYSGSQPAGPGSAATGTKLAEFDLPDPAFGDASSGQATANSISTTTGLDDGTAGWFRVLDRDETAVWDAEVADSGITFNTTTISTGVDVDVTSWTVTMPSGA